MTIDERIIDQTLFSDLDEIEASLCYIDDWIKAITELRAAREAISKIAEIVKFGKELDTYGYDSFPIDGIIALEKILNKYDEARRG